MDIVGVRPEDAHAPPAGIPGGGIKLRKAQVGKLGEGIAEILAKMD